MKTRKTTSIALVIVLSLIIGMLPARAGDYITVTLDGNVLEFDVQPQIIRDRTMVPMRKIFESLGAVVTWDAPTQTATGKKGDTIVNVSIDSKVLFKNGVPKSLDVAPTLIESRTLVPRRAIAESFDCEVLWIAETKTVQITTGESFVSEKAVLTATEISDRVAPSVFYIEVYDEKSNPFATGSGFFISSDGVAVTNYHVIDGSSSANITTVGGDVFPITNILAFDEALDVAIIRIGKTSVNGKTVSGFPAAVLGDSSDIKAGQAVYAIGSPIGLQNTISNGIISNTNRVIEESEFIQVTAPISIGSSGGALLNEYGEVLGITSAIAIDAQNIGLVIPINIIKTFDTSVQGMSYTDFVKKNAAFTLEIDPEVIEIEVGKTDYVLVAAEGKGDWSIYWHTNERGLVDCEWGDWLEDYPSVCTLNIKALREGTAIITVYSDVDFNGKEITVHIKRPAVATYMYSSVPTYTAITGRQLYDYKKMDVSDAYSYDFYPDEVERYIEYLENTGYKFYKKYEEPDFVSFYFSTPDSKMLCVSVNYKYSTVAILIPRV